ncbi:hypothetical protein Godav_003189 [Gossypium davidsonii]|uniref:Uncharacterized protein n=1 Tax=Gossypium davidsonii TaxID=34287 RepID=A0A7J8SYY7_GOSDV|nr:hypothetical protein [Gossypium davidsonii]
MVLLLPKRQKVPKWCKAKQGNKLRVLESNRDC